MSLRPFRNEDRLTSVAARRSTKNVTRISSRRMAGTTHLDEAHRRGRIRDELQLPFNTSAKVVVLLPRCVGHGNAPRGRTCIAGFSFRTLARARNGPPMAEPFDRTGFPSG